MKGASALPHNAGQIVDSAFPLAAVVNGTLRAPSLIPSGILVWSDDPENLFHGVVGRTYQDRITGRFRVFDYHLNRSGTQPDGAAASPYDLCVGFALTAPASAIGDTYVYRNKHAMGTGTHWASAAQSTLAAWFRSPAQDENIAVLSPGESTYIEQAVAPGAVSVIMVDVVATDGRGAERPIFVTTYAWRSTTPPYPTDPSSLPTTAHRSSPPARATFPYHTLSGSFTPASGTAAVCISLGQNPRSGSVPALGGEYQAGTDALDAWAGPPIFNVGNYGVVYNLTLTLPPGSASDIELNPRGGDDLLVAVVGPSGFPLTSPLVPATAASWFVGGGQGPGDFVLRHSLVASQPSPIWLAVRPRA